MIDLPRGAELVRTTSEFDEGSVPRGLLRAHRVATGVWGRLMVSSGSLAFRFEDEDTDRIVEAGSSQVIPPDRLHHVAVDGPVRFVVEFHESPVP